MPSQALSHPVRPVRPPQVIYQSPARAHVTTTNPVPSRLPGLAGPRPAEAHHSSLMLCPNGWNTIQSDSSAEALAQHSAKSSSASAGSAQLTNATALVDFALKESVSGSGNHSERLPSLLLSKELDDVPFQTRLQTVIEGLEQVNSPSKGESLVGPAPKVAHADGSVTDAKSEADYKSYFSPFAYASPAEVP